MYACMLRRFSCADCNPMDCSPPGSSVHGTAPSKSILQEGAVKGELIRLPPFVLLHLPQMTKFSHKTKLYPLLIQAQKFILKKFSRSSVVVQWLRICLPVRETEKLLTKHCQCRRHGLDP